MKMDKIFAYLNIDSTFIKFMMEIERTKEEFLVMKKFLTLLTVAATFFTLSMTAFAQETKETYLVKFEQTSDFTTYSSFGIQSEEVGHEFESVDMVEADLTEEKVAELENNPNISYVEKDIPVHAYQQDVPYGIEKVQAPIAHQNGDTGDGVKLGIIDTGIDSSHEDLNVLGGHSVFTSGIDGDPYNDGSGHGTHVAGTAAALDNNAGVVGVAPDADLYAVKVLNSSGSGTSSGVAQGVEWAIQNGMDVINMSLGSSTSSQAIQDVVDAAYYDHDILVVAAAGNEGNASGTGNTVGYPAQYDSAFAVAATDENDQRASFSSTGPAVDISAPGANIYSTVPGNGYDSLNGTSMASPHVAGAGAVIRASFPSASAEEVRSLMQASSKHIGSNTYWYGSGLLQVDTE